MTVLGNLSAGKKVTVNPVCVLSIQKTLGGLPWVGNCYLERIWGLRGYIHHKDHKKQTETHHRIFTMAKSMKVKLFPFLTQSSNTGESMERGHWSDGVWGHPISSVNVLPSGTLPSHVLNHGKSLRAKQKTHELRLNEATKPQTIVPWPSCQ